MPFVSLALGGVAQLLLFLVAQLGNCGVLFAPDH